MSRDKETPSEKESEPQKQVAEKVKIDPNKVIKVEPRMIKESFASTILSKKEGEKKNK